MDAANPETDTPINLGKHVIVVGRRNKLQGSCLSQKMGSRLQPYLLVYKGFVCKNKTNIRITQNKLSIFDNQIWIIRAFERQGQEGAWNGQANTPPDRRARQEQESSFCAVVWAEWPVAHFSLVCQQYSARSHPAAFQTPTTSRHPYYRNPQTHTHHAGPKYAQPQRHPSDRSDPLAVNRDTKGKKT